MASRLPHLLSPGRIGTLELKNRIVHAPMSLGLGAGDGTCGDHHIAYHEARARGGAALINIGTVSVGYPFGAVDLKQIALSDDRYIPSIRSLAEAIHRHDAKIVLQLNHNGLMAGLDREQGRPLATPSAPVAKPSEVPAAYLPAELAELVAATKDLPAPTYRVLTPQEITGIVDLYAAAAGRAREAGIDAIEIHGGHGYILSSFLSPFFNQRTDAYGGSLANRARFLLEVIRAVRRTVGDEFPVWCKLDSEEFHQDEGITLEDARQTALWAEAAGVDAICVSAYYDGSRAASHSSAHTPATPELLVANAKTIKAALRVPVLTAGRIEVEVADRHIENGHFDFVVLGRKLLADPELPAKLAAGRSNDVRPCVYCYDCISQAYFRRPILCAVNPEMGRELAFAGFAPSVPRRVVVVGGGPAGLESARRLALRGHQVVLIERSGRLGGRLHAASRLFRSNRDIALWLERQVAQLPIEVRLDTEATPELIAELAPDRVVLANGHVMPPPAMPGIDSAHVLAGEDLLNRIEEDRLELPSEGRIVVIGGGVVGLPLAQLVAERGHRVFVLEQASAVGAGMPFVRRLATRDALRSLDVPLLTGAREIAFGEVGVAYTNSFGQRRVLGADRVLVTLGGVPDLHLLEGLRRQGTTVTPVGDAAGTHGLTSAFRSAADVATSIDAN